MPKKAPRYTDKKENYQGLLVLGIVLALLVFAAGMVYWLTDGARLAQAADIQNAARIERGNEIYTAQCSACHGAEGEGGVGPALKNRKVLKNTPDQIFFSVIRSGVPNTQMPSWSVDFGGPLTDDEIHDTVAFLRSWEATAPEVTAVVAPPDPARGAALFTSTCAICHGENGKGGKPGIPVLNDSARLAKLDDSWYRDVIANGRPAKGMPTWGTVLAPAQLDDLVALIAAWRGGEAITPSFSVTDLIDQALFSLTQQDAGSALLNVNHALEVASGAGAVVLRNVAAQLEAGDTAGAETALKTLQEQWPIGDAAQGAAIYSAECAVCHGPQGEGLIGKPLRPNQFVQDQTNAQLLQFILDGRPGTAMAGFTGRLDENQIADTIAFLRLWQK